MRVRAVDEAGNVDATPVVHSWVVIPVSSPRPGSIAGGGGSQDGLNVVTVVGGADSPPDFLASTEGQSSEARDGGIKGWFDDVADTAGDNMLATVSISIGVLSILLMCCVWACVVCRKTRANRMSERLVDLEHQLATVQHREPVQDAVADETDMVGCQVATVLEASLPANCRRFAYRELYNATGGFQDASILGEGGFGKVFHGVLNDGTQVAVKRLEKG